MRERTSGEWDVEMTGALIFFSFVAFYIVYIYFLNKEIVLLL